MSRWVPSVRVNSVAEESRLIGEAIQMAIAHNLKFTVRRNRDGNTTARFSRWDEDSDIYETISIHTDPIPGVAIQRAWLAAMEKMAEVK